MTNIFSSADLLKLGYEEDGLLHEDPSLCSLCSHTCNSATAIRPVRV